MRTLTEKYNGVLKGLFSKDQFLRDARMEQSHLVTQHNSYQDAVNILLGKGLISEVVEELPIKEEEGGTLQQVKQEAQRISKEQGVVQHVNYLGNGLYGLSDWFDDDKTVVSYENGVAINEQSPIGEETHKAYKDSTNLELQQYLVNLNTELKGESNPAKIELIKKDIAEIKKEIESRSKKEGAVEEKKLTPAEKAGKEKIIKGLKKSGMSKDDPSTYAIATAKAKELYEEEVEEGTQDVHSAVDSVLELIRKHARSLNDEDAYQFHEMLKKWFNSLTEDTVQEATALVRNDEIEHIPSGVTLRVSVVTPNRISGVITNAGTVKGKDLRVGDVAFIRPVEMGAVWRKLDKSKEEPSYSNISESKDDSKIAKPELPLDVLHHGIRFELEKKKPLGTTTEEEYLKAYKTASKNLEKDLLYYKKEEGAAEAPTSKADEMVKVKLKESFKNIIRKMLSEDNSKTKRPFNIKGQAL